MHHPILDLRGVSFTYGDGTVLRDVDLSIREGAFCGIVGPSGAGKTTLLRLMEGSLRPTAGTVESRPDGRRPPRLGVVPQLETIDWTFPITVEEVVLLGTAAGRPTCSISSGSRISLGGTSGTSPGGSSSARSLPELSFASPISSSSTSRPAASTS